MSATPAAPKLRLRGVAKAFDAGAGRTLAIAGVDLDVAAGEFACIVGPSGCGKSTVLNLIAGLDRPSEGRIEKDGAPIPGPGADRGVMFQDYALFPWLSVRDNVAFGLRHGPRARRLDAARRAAVVDHFVALVGLKEAQGKYPHQLSGGMRQRCALARLLANEPDVLLMDEPLAALDAQTRIILQSELLRIWGEVRPQAERKTAVFVTHAIEEAVFLGDRVIVMRGQPGRIGADIPVTLPRPRTEEMRADPAFGRLVQEIWGLIRDQALRAIA